MPNPANSNPGHLEDEREQGRFEGSPLFLASDRRTFLQGAAATAVAGAANLSWPGLMNAAVAAADFDAIRAEIEKRHDEAVKRLQDWIRQPSIAAENRGMNEGCELTMRMLRDAGFQQATKIPTEPEGPGSIIPRGAARHSRRRQETARESGVRCRGRRGNRFTALSANRAPAGGDGGPEELSRNFHAERLAGTGRRSHHDAGRERRH